MMMKIQVVVFWVVTPYSDVVGYQCFRGPCCLPLRVKCVELGSGHRYGTVSTKGSRVVLSRDKHLTPS